MFFGIILEYSGYVHTNFVDSGWGKNIERSLDRIVAEVQEGERIIGVFDGIFWFLVLF